jgi:SAM-dependent methyltransferase
MAIDDAEERRRLLEGWAVEQHRKTQGTPRGPSRAKMALSKARYRLVARSHRWADRLFDRGLDTAGTITEPEHDHPDRVRYVPSDWHVLPRALRYLGVSNKDTFIDFGCGKGRVVHQAAKRPFRRVIGVEVSPALAEIARRALAARRRRHRCGSVEIVVSDVADYLVPDDLTIAYFYHPFTDDTFGAVLKGITDSIDRRPRRVRLIYLLPIQGSRILDTGRFRLLTEQRSRLLDVPGARAAIFESV